MEFLKDDVPIRPGEEGFTSFPKHLSEDSVSYQIFILDQRKAESETQLRDCLRGIQTTAVELQKKHLEGYMWQRESFNLKLKRENNRPFLQGSTEFGDSLADEWVIVYLLREISKQHKNAWIRVCDEDGEFLLIEAANKLPAWLNPEIADNRVWINDTHLHILPLDSPKENSQKANRLYANRKIDLDDALRYIKAHEPLINSPEIESEAFYRIRNHPAQIAESFHTSTIIAPRRLAYILQRTPAHVNQAIEAFYVRDPISLKPFQANAKVELDFPPRDLVDMSVRFTKVGFAQLKSQEFAYPARWTMAIPKLNDPKIIASAEMGMKLACAFEMLVKDPQNKSKRSVREIQLLFEDLENGEEELPTDAEIATWARQDDDESWLDIDYEDFEKELAGQRESVEGEPRAFGDKSAQDNLRKVVERFEQFLKEEGTGFEGVDDHDDMDFDEEDSDEDEEAGDHDERLEFLTPEQLQGFGDGALSHEQLADAFQQLMNIPTSKNASRGVGDQDKTTEADGTEYDDEQELQELAKGMEAELKELGFLNSAYNSEEERHALAKNLLESLRGGGASSGPTASLLSSFGMSVPRDNGENNKSLK